MEIGRRLATWRTGKAPAGMAAGAGAGTAIFGLMGLLIAFTFSAADSRFDQRRQLIVQEVNAIGTAYLRLEILPARSQPHLRKLFREYVDARIDSYRQVPDIDLENTRSARVASLQREIWAEAVAASGEASSPAVMTLILQSLNEMVDITTTRSAATRMHAPSIILVMLGLLVLTCAMLAGHDMAASPKRSWSHIFGFAILMTLAVYVILDLEYPRVGLIRVDPLDRMLVDLRRSMD
jgi:hypothetical protein